MELSWAFRFLSRLPTGVFFLPHAYCRRTGWRVVDATMNPRDNRPPFIPVSVFVGRIFSVGEANELSVFDGLRVLSMLWVVLGHTLAVQVRA